MKKRIISLLMCFCMVVSLLPTSVLAASDEATNDSELTEQSSAQSMTTKASAEKEQIYWAIVNTGNSEEKLVISAAEYLLQDGESYEKQGNGGDAKGSFDVDYKFESPDDPVWHHWWYYITTADVLADGNGKKVAPTYTRYWFYEQKNLTSVNLSGLDMSNVIDAQGMFAECQSITNLDAVADWNVENVKYMGSMFSDCSGLTSLDISRWKVCNLDDGGGSALASMFYGCSNLTTLALPNFQGKISNTRYMFKNCSKLETLTLPLGFLSQGFSYSSNFAGPLMSEMFYGCSSLTNLDVSGWNVSGVYSMEQLFYNCSSLTNLDVSRWDVSKVKEMEKMFYNCSSLTSLDLAGWDLSIEKYSLVDMFTGCSELSAVNLTGGCPAILYGSTNSDGQNSNGIMLPGSLIAYVKHEETENGKKQSAAWIYPGQSSGMLFVTDGGTLSETDLTDPSKVTVTKDGKTSNGWCEKGNNIPVSNFTNGTVYYPYYRPETCTVSFDANAQGVDNPNKRNVKYGETLGTLPTLNRDGYAFLGWFTAAEGGTKVTADTSITYSMTLYARYIANTYTVKFDDNGATSGKMDDQTFSYDTAKNLTPNAFVKTGYTFAGWSTTEDGSVAYKDGEEVKNLSAVDGDEITLYAQWTTNSYTVKFNGNGATSGKMDDQTFGYDVAKKLTQNAFVKTGYTFAGWKDGNDNTYMDEQEVKNLTAVQGDVVTLTAQWTPTQYRISYELNGGTNANANPAVYTIEDNDVTLVAPTREGYTFSGWTWEGQTEPTVTAVISKGSTGNKSFTANWMANTYTIHFVGGDGTEGSTVDVSATYDQSVKLMPNGFTKADWKFLGWRTSNATTVEYTDGQTVTNLTADDDATVTLYAVWQEKSEFNPNLEVQHQIYDGHAKEFTLDGGYTIAYKQGAETVSEPIEAGTYDVVITKAADDDHKAYLRTFEGGLIIDKADVTNTAKDNQHCIFGDTYDVSSLFEKDVNAGEATYALAENTDEGAGSAKLDGTILTITKAGTIKITMTTAGTNNYNAGVAVTATLTVDKASPKVNISVDKASVVGGGTVKLTVSGVPNGGKVTVTQTDDRGSTAENLDLTANGEISVRLSNMVAKYTFTVVYDGDDNHNGDKDSCEVSVTRRTSSVANPGNTISVPSTPNGTVTVTPSTASKDTTVTITTKPNEGYELGDLTVKDANGNTLPLTDKGDGKYTFTMPDSKVSVEAEFVKAASTGFVDVPVNAYFADAVKWAVDRGITNGLSDTMFGPYESCTRAQIVTFLWRAAGSPEPKTVSSFSDVPASAYYAKAVAWAVENGITNGMTETTFEPNATCTRGQSVTFLYRALKGTASGSASFTDVAPDAFYADAVNWAVANNVTNGTSATTFSPNADCTRAEIVTFLYRAYQGK